MRALEAAELWLVDGYNVLCSALRGRRREAWWGAGERDALVELASHLDAPSAQIWVAFDGPRPAEARRADRVRRVYARSADAWLLARLRQQPVPGRVVVVTADRRLAGRARGRGARVVDPREFAARCGFPRGEDLARAGSAAESSAEDPLAAQDSTALA